MTDIQETPLKSQDSSSGLVWAVCALLAILATTAATYFIWSQKQPIEHSPTYVNLGELDAYAEDARLVKATIVLEVGDKKKQEQLSQHMARDKAAILEIFSDFPGDYIQTAEGKLALQQTIRKGLNNLHGAPVVSEVLFTNFYMSIG